MNTQQQQDTEQTGNGWRPNEGDRVEGKVANLTRGWSDASSSYYPIVTLDTANGPVDVHCFHTVLQRELAELRPKLGDRLAIIYKGKRAHKKDPNRTVADYEIDAPDREVDAGAFWRAIAGDTEPEPEPAAAVETSASAGAPEADIPW